jgi:hypothetical protein
MRLISFLIVSILIIFNTGICFSAEDKSFNPQVLRFHDTAAKKDTFVSPTLRYHIHYPEGWESLSNLMNENAPARFIYWKVKDKLPFIAISEGKLKPEDKNLMDYALRDKEESLKNNPNLVIDGPFEVNLGTRAAAQLIFKSPKSFSEQILILIDRTVIIFHYADINPNLNPNLEDVKKDRDIFKQVVNSFEVE